MLYWAAETIPAGVLGPEASGRFDRFFQTHGSSRPGVSVMVLAYGRGQVMSSERIDRRYFGIEVDDVIEIAEKIDI